MLREFGLLCVLLLPAILLYLSRQDNNNNLPTEKRTKTKPKKKKKKSKTQTSAESKPITTSDSATSNTTKKTDSKADVKVEQPKQAATETTTSTNTTPATPRDKQSNAAEVDEHMDFTPRYSRVMRITTEPEEEFEPVPQEEGWESVPVSSRTSRTPKPAADEPLTKKQRENQARAAKRKEQKAAMDALQAERLRKHRKELEKLKIEEFYSKGAGKHTPWGKKPSSKRPTATAGVNEHGQLIWD